MKRNGKTGCIVIAILLVFCCAFLCSCQKREAAIGVMKFPDTLDPQIETDPATQELFLCAFRNLLRSDNGKMICDAAERYTISEDGLSLTFFLREGMTWSDGREVTADDYAFSLERILSPQTKSPYAQLLFCIKGAEAFYTGTGPLSGVSCPDKLTLTLHLSQPDNRLLSQFASTFLSPCNRALFEETAGAYGMSISKTLFNGNYRVVSKGSETIVLTLRDGVGKLPKKICFREISSYDADTLREELLSGTLSAAVSTLHLEPSDRLITQTFTNAVHFLAFGNREGFCGDPDFAKMLALSSVGELQIQSGQATILPASYYEYLCGKAQSAPIDAAGAKKMLGTLLERYQLQQPPKVVLLVPDDPFSRKISDTLVTQWQKYTGLFVSREYASASALAARIRQGDFDAAIFCGESYATTAEGYYTAIASAVPYTGAAQRLADLSSLQDADYLKACENVFAQTGKLFAISAEQSFFYRSEKTRNICWNEATGNIQIYEE